MSAAIPDSGPFTVDLPVWTVVEVSTLNTVGFPMCAAMGMSPFGRVQPLFTDEDLARRYIEEIGSPDRVPFAIRDDETLLSLLQLADSSGITHVAIDTPAAPNPRGEWQRYVRFDQLRVTG
jgi:hypothetical protein